MSTIVYSDFMGKVNIIAHNIIYTKDRDKRAIFFRSD